jgi:hypothetical protein
MKDEHKLDNKILKDALIANLHWFENSGVMVPSNGLWGVAERVALKGNTSMDKIYRSFPAWTELENHSIIEQRRADCNFEAALLFLMGAEVLNCKKYRKIAENILDFLYFRSGMLNRFPADEGLEGCWYWSHIGKSIYFDDNSWNCVISLMICGKYPELEKKYEMRKWALMLADTMAKAFMSHFMAPPDFKPSWMGNLCLPHWGSMVCMVMAKAYSVSPNPAYKEVADKYTQFLEEKKDSFISSEQAYAMLGTTFCHCAFKDEKFIRLAEFFGDKLIGLMDPQTGNLPSEHRESPIGLHLVDTIYTVNWALLGFQLIGSVDSKEKYRTAFLKLLNLMVMIQDKSQENHLRGCWRGMYDLKADTWGGGDCYEGGANSIYTGWTNAPISWAIASELLDRSLYDLI